MYMIFEQLKTMLAEQFGVDADTITMETSFEDDLGADSLDLVDMSMALEELFGVEEGSEKSLCVVNDVLFYKSKAGIMAYNKDIT